MSNLNLGIPYTVIIGAGKTGLSCVRYLQKKGSNFIVMDSRKEAPGFSELAKNYPDVPVFRGEIDKDIIARAKGVVISPGINLPEVEGISDIELFAREARAPIVAITGSNGKSTVTTLVGKMAKEAGLRVKVGGNLGTPALDLLDDRAELYVLELSSFQLERTYSLKAAAATVLNITPDHLDWHKSMEAYVKAKMRIYSGSKVAIVNRNCTISSNLKHGSICSFGLNIPKEDQLGVVDGFLAYGNNKLLPVNDLLLKGKYQAENALAALGLGMAIKLPLSSMLKTLRLFSGLPHRCQWVANISGVNWYNDSKATNVGAAKAAIEGLGESISGKIVLIAGGQGKGADFELLSPSVRKYVKTVVLMGEDATKLASVFGKFVQTEFVESMPQAIQVAGEYAKKGDIVLLSPACASFDMFANFEDRGRKFEEYVEIYKQTKDR